METLEWAREHSIDGFYDYPDIITPETGLDIKVPDKPDYFAMPARNNVITIDVSSYRGISAGAIHYYGKIRWTGPKICSKSEDGHIIRHGGYISEGWKNMPREQTAIFSGVEIEVARILTQEEYDEDPDRWYGYHPGHSKTNAFETVAEVIDTAKKIIEVRFQGDFEIKVEHNYY